MSDDPVRTLVSSDGGELAFQDYFVRRRCSPQVTGIRFDGAAAARMQPEVSALLASPETEAIIVCPSNPYLSIDPILAVPGLRAALRAAPAPVIAVTPIVGAQAVKGPTAKIMRELGIAVSPQSVADYYADFLDGFLLDSRDAAGSQIELPVRVADTLMVTLEDKMRVAAAALNFAREIRAARP
jgi:LPPG:FO 2-phospho-L-lactate transferase